MWRKLNKETNTSRVAQKKFPIKPQAGESFGYRFTRTLKRFHGSSIHNDQISARDLHNYQKSTRNLIQSAFSVSGNVVPNPLFSYTINYLSSFTPIDE